MIYLQKTEKDSMNFQKSKPNPEQKKLIKMQALIVHPKNQMELNALKGVMKEMGIRYEKFHTRGVKTQNFEPHTPKKEKPVRNFKDNPKKDK